jgi:hypothetical protein
MTCLLIGVQIRDLSSVADYSQAKIFCIKLLEYIFIEQNIRMEGLN